jgi:hypothetical protein
LLEGEGPTNGTREEKKAIDAINPASPQEPSLEGSSLQDFMQLSRPIGNSSIKENNVDTLQVDL